MNIVEKYKTNKERKKLISQINKKELEKLCFKLNQGINNFSEFFLKLLIENENLIAELNKNIISQELFDKINKNDYQIQDISFNDLWIIKYLKFTEKDQKIIKFINKSTQSNIDYQNKEYYFVHCNNFDELTKLSIEKQNITKSYLNTDIKINKEKLFPIQNFYYSEESKITICNLINKDQVIQEEDLSLFYKEDIKIDKDTVICIEYSEFLKLSKDQTFLDKISNCRIIFKEDHKGVSEISSNSFNSFNYKEDKSTHILIKINHLLYTINNSKLSEEKKEIYTYKITKYYSSLKNEEDYYTKYQSYSEFKNILAILQKEISKEKIEEIKEKFNNQNLETKTKEIENKKYSATIFIESIEGLENITTTNLMREILKLKDEEIEIVLTDQRILIELKKIFPKESTIQEKISILTRELELQKYSLNDDIINFIKRHNIDLKKLMAAEEINIKSTKDINYLIHKFGIISSNKKTNISISQILGFDKDFLDNRTNNLLLSLENFFNSKGDGYHTRSIGLLEYTTKEIIEKLQRSFITEPLILQEADKDKYCIATNGMHRYTILRLHYLIEKILLNKNEQELNQKYTIPVNLKKTDYFKTYCNYLLQTIDNNISFLKSHLDENYNYTNFTEVITKDGKKQILSDQELKELVEHNLTNTNEITLMNISYYYYQYQSFKDFIDNNFKELAQKITSKKGENYGEDYQNRRSHN